MTLKNSRGDWIYRNKTWTVPKENREGYVSELENNSLVLGLMDGKSATMKLHIQWTLVIVNSILSPILFTNERCSLFSM